MSLQQELYEGFARHDFQQSLKALQAAHPHGGATFMKERNRLFLSVQANAQYRFVEQTNRCNK